MAEACHTLCRAGLNALMLKDLSGLTNVREGALDVATTDLTGQALPLTRRRAVSPVKRIVFWLLLILWTQETVLAPCIDTLF